MAEPKIVEMRCHKCWITRTYSLTEENTLSCEMGIWPFFIMQPIHCSECLNEVSITIKEPK